MAAIFLVNLSPEVLSLLENYNYPGNVRELENIIERAIVIAPTDEITVGCLRPEVRDPQSAMERMSASSGKSGSVDLKHGVSFYDEVKNYEIDLIRRALDQTGGHQSRAARLLGLNATTLNSKIKSYNIKENQHDTHIQIIGINFKSSQFSPKTLQNAAD